ncbi:type IV secretory system conjugative DNA transfer family protein [Nocardia sp. NPDC059240]|uniref:type IV secretory system conjugative DNA transfer family protein n=1 Tax=Nocardia sp. NPDC059240 TaxID=3346786 RepID=UPI003683AD1F
MPTPTPVPVPDRSPEHGWLGRLLSNPGHALRRAGELAGWPLTGGHLVGVGIVVAGVLAAVAVLRRARQTRLAAGARQVTILCPPSVDPGAAAALWAHLYGLLRPPWRRFWCGQPHLGFEYRVTAADGVTLAVWVPATIPPGLIERAVRSAWPGARTRELDPADPPLPAPGTGERLVLAGGELRLGRAEGFPIRSEHGTGEIARDLLTAAADLEPGQAVCVQILARPVTGHRVRHAVTGRRGGTAATLGRTLRGLAREVLDLVEPGLHRSPQVRAVSADRYLQMEEGTRTRAAVTKARGGHYETLIRYSATVAVPVAADADRSTVTAARALARGRAHALATVFGACADHNFYRRHRSLRLAAALQGRWLGRGDLLSIPELAAIAHLPTDPSVPGLARAGARALAPATEIPVGGAHTKPLGTADAGTGQRPVALRVADARHHLHVFGATGVGKSTLLGNLILDDVEAGRGVMVVDPKGDLVTDVLDRLPRRVVGKVVLFDADSRQRPPCVNPLDTTPEGMDLAIDNLATILSRIYSRWWGPRTDDVLRVSLRTLCAQSGTATLVDLVRMLTGEANIERLTREINDPVVRGFWAAHTDLSPAAAAQVVAPLLNKLRTFLLRPFVRDAIAAGPSTVDLREVLDGGGICLARLPKGSLGEDTTKLMGSLLVARTWQTVTARAAVPASERPDASLVLDEAQNFLNLSTPVEDMAAEARGLCLSLVLAHQNLGQLPRELREGISANARNKIIFSASPEDARDLARHTAPWLSEHDLTHLDVHHAAARLLVRGQQTPPFTLTTRPLPDPIPGRAAEIRAAIRAAGHTPRRATVPDPTATATGTTAPPDTAAHESDAASGIDPRLS